MRIFAVALLAAMLPCTAPADTVFSGDARRGEQIFRSESCVGCHSLNGEGGKLAPDLGKRIDRNYTPAVMASVMWNHAPAMWAAMRRQGIVKSTLLPESAADLFAFFYSSRSLRNPGMPAAASSSLLRNTARTATVSLNPCRRGLHPSRDGNR